MLPTPPEFNEAPDIEFWNAWVKGAIEQYREQLEDEFGQFTTIDLPLTCRVILVPEEATMSDEWMVCYPSHYTGGAPRLIVDDNVPEAGDIGEVPPDQRGL